MGRIYSKAQKKLQHEAADEILAYIDQVKDTDNWHDLLLEKLNCMLAETDRRITPETKKKAWDFSREKAQPVFATDGEITLRPFTANDKAFYFNIRKQWCSPTLRKSYSNENDYLWDYTQQDYAFYCMVELAETLVGYVAIHDSREGLWELAVEFDRDYCYKGLGPKSIMLFLRKIEEITMISTFKAKVEVDNLACQKCMNKIGAKLTRLSDSSFRDEKEAEKFEEENLDLIDDHVRTLATQLSVDPRSLLSHVLEYEIEV